MVRWTNEGQINGVCEGLTIRLEEMLPEAKNCSGGVAMSGYTLATRLITTAWRVQAAFRCDQHKIHFTFWTLKRWIRFYPSSYLLVG